MKRPRDSQKQKLYSAERAIASETVGDGSIADVTLFVNKVLSSAVVRRNYPNTPTRLHVKDGRGTRIARGGLGGLSLPAGWARKELVVLHEIAHALNSADAEYERRRKTDRAAREATERGTNYWRNDFAARRKEIEKCEPRASHGWQFASILLDLVRWFMGAEQERALKVAFRAHRVRFTAKKQLSPEQRQAAAYRLRAARKRLLLAAHEPPQLDPLGEQWESWIERNSR